MNDFVFSLYINMLSNAVGFFTNKQHVFNLQKFQSLILGVMVGIKAEQQARWSVWGVPVYDLQIAM